MPHSHLSVAVIAAVVVATSLATGVRATDYSGGEYCKDAVAAVEVHVSDVVNKPIDRVWDLIRNFRKTDFIPANITAANGRAGDQLGARRIISYQEGVKALEELVAIDRINYMVSYIMFPHSGVGGNLPPRFNGTPGPVCAFLTTIKLYPITLKRATLVVWQSSWTTTPSAAPVSKATGTQLAKLFVLGMKKLP